MIHNYNLNENQFFRTWRGFVLQGCLLAVVMWLGLRYGSAVMSISEFWGGFFRLEGYETSSLILYSVRLPRVFAGVLAGIGLSVSGVLLQSITDNGLAGPNIIGVNAGAGFAVVLLLSFFPMAAVQILPFGAFLGAFLATIVIMALAGGIGSSKSTLILAGVAMTALLNAGISFMTLLDADVLTSYNAFSVGGLQGITLSELAVPLMIISLSFIIGMGFSRRIEVLCLGDCAATALGIGVKVLRAICMVCASASAAAVVSFAGLLGFVGLIVPHMARKLVGGKTSFLLPVSAVLGAMLVVLGDLLGRVLAAPSEIPVGIMMAFVGAPFFMVLLFKRGREFE